MITLNLSSNVFIPKFFPYIYDYSNRFECYMGSAGSGKSYFITQKLIVRACTEKMRIMVCRRYASTIRNSVFSLFKEVLEHWQIKQYCKINESDFRITLPNGSEIIFLGLDSEEKLLSLNNITCVFIEEAFEITREMLDQLSLRMRGGKNQQILMAWNPISKRSWLYEFCEVTPPTSFLYLHSTYKDNPFLSPEYVKELDELKERNPAKAKIYCYGEWGVPQEGQVFKDWHIEDFDENALAGRLGNAVMNHRVGLDFGYIDPSAVVESLWDKENRKIYVFKEFYKSGCQLDTVYNAIVKMGLTRNKILMDSAEPRSIDYFRQKGINAQPCIKGQDSVNARIAFLQNHTIIVKPSCTNVITELENFSYIKDKQTGIYTNKTTHEWSHSLDALGYSYSDIYSRTQLRTLDKSVLGL